MKPKSNTRAILEASLAAIAILFILSLADMATQPDNYTINSTVAGKTASEAYTETKTTPPGYQYTCGYSINLKIECGWNYYISEDRHTIRHPATYTLLLTTEQCSIPFQVEKETFDLYEVGDTFYLRASGPHPCELLSSTLTPASP